MNRFRASAYMRFVSSVKWHLHSFLDVLPDVFNEILIGFPEVVSGVCIGAFIVLLPVVAGFFA